MYSIAGSIQIYSTPSLSSRFAVGAAICGGHARAEGRRCRPPESLEQYVPAIRLRTAICGCQGSNALSYADRVYLDEDEEDLATE